METSTILTILSIIGGLIVAIKGAFALFQFIVQNIITPLTLNISALQDTTRELKSLLERVRGDMQSLDKRLTIVEQSVKSLTRDWTISSAYVIRHIRLRGVTRNEVS